MTEQEAMLNPLPNEIISAENPLKQMLVDYVGKKYATEEDEGNFDVTVQMITEVLASEFPEFVLVMAEENWLRGYNQGLDDAELSQTETKEINRTGE